MKNKLQNLSKLTRPYRVVNGKKFHLDDFKPLDTGKLDLEDKADEILRESVERLSDMQEKLYAQDRWALLIILQAMDAGGKDSAIRHVMSGVNPEGCQVYSFKQPSAEDLSHDYLWRAAKCLPQRGYIGIFNRSYYEEVLVVRVHPHLLQNERLPPDLVTKKLWKERFEDINAFERYLTRNGTVIRKFFLNVARDEQRQRFLDRLNEPDKNWKFSEADVREREHWGDYMEAYEDAIRHTATPRTLVCGSSGSQMVREARRRLSDRSNARRAPSIIPEGHRKETCRAFLGPQVAARGRQRLTAAEET